MQVFDWIDKLPYIFVITNNSCCRFLLDESATIRVTNLSEDTRESDLQELFRPFGTIQRIYLAKDKVTGQSKVSKKFLLNISWVEYGKVI